MILSGNEAWNRNVSRRKRKVDRDGADITLSGRLFQMVGPATGKARPPTVDSFTDGTSRRLARAEPMNALLSYLQHGKNYRHFKKSLKGHMSRL